MEIVSMKKFPPVKADGSHKQITAFQEVEFTVNYFGAKDTFTLNTKIMKSGRQFVIEGNGWINQDYEILDCVYFGGGRSNENRHNILSRRIFYCILPRI